VHRAIPIGVATRLRYEEGGMGRERWDNSLNWKKSTASESGGCVEVAKTESFVHVRDSKNPKGPKLAFPATEWKAFLVGLHGDEFDLDRLVG
jgi:hypothetical protein